MKGLQAHYMGTYNTDGTSEICITHIILSVQVITFIMTSFQFTLASVNYKHV
jgi:hypothetical protein